MMRQLTSGLLSTLLLPAPLVASANATAAFATLQMLREGGCGGVLPAMPLLQPDAALDRAAAQWANGAAMAAAARSNGYPAREMSGVHVTGPSSGWVELLRRGGCRTIGGRELRDVGVYERGMETWFLLASRAAPPDASAVPVAAGASSATRALQLVNDIRAHVTRCGGHSFAAAPPVKLSDTLSDVARGHAADMARRNYFEHEDLSGRTPAERVRAAGYAEKLVGENIAYGPETADEVVQGWLDSPGHCENIMDPRFAEMGIAYSIGRASHHGLYWVQLLAAPGT